jgi:hypothetical protein
MPFTGNVFLTIQAIDNSPGAGVAVFNRTALGLTGTFNEAVYNSFPMGVAFSLGASGAAGFYVRNIDPSGLYIGVQWQTGTITSEITELQPGQVLMFFGPGGTGVSNIVIFPITAGTVPFIEYILFA